MTPERDRRRLVSMTADATPTLAALRRARAHHDTARRWTRRLSVVVVAVVLVLATRGDPGPGTHGTPLLVSVALGGLVAGALGVLASRWIPRTAALVLLLAGSSALMWLQPHGPGLYGVLVTVGALASRAPRRLSGVATGLAFGYLAAAIAVTRHGHVPSVVARELGLFAVLTMVLLAHRLRRANEQAERMLVELKRTRAAQERAAALAERQRLAREMHDVLAHSLAGLVLNLEGARLLAERQGDARLTATLNRAHHLAGKGLEEAQRTIGMLRDEELPGPDRLAALAAEFERDSRVRCRFTTSGDRRDLDSAVRVALYRIAQEALTNIRKHACPQRVELHLGYEPSGVRLAIEDFGTGAIRPRADVPGGGYGLTGMRERAELLDGTLDAAPTAGGFHVQLRVPAA
jgi:signal transduction histidine kinase